MNFNHLLIFHKVAEKQHFTRAAEALFISQPAVSKQIHQLEHTLGQALFTRVGQKVYLTEAGQLLYEYSTRIFALTDEAEDALEEMRNLERGRLAIGASTTIGTYLLPELLGRYKACYPRVRLSLAIANAGEIEEKVLANQVEIGLVEGLVTHPELYQEVWQQDMLVPIVAPDHPLVGCARLTIGQVLEQGTPFILRESGSGTRAVLEQALEKRGLGAGRTIIMELGSTEAIKRAVAAGLGIAFVSVHTISLELAVGRLRRLNLADFSLQRSLYITYIHEKRLSRAARAFLEQLRVAATLLSEHPC